MSAAGFANGLALTDSFVAGTEYGARFHNWLEITQGMEKDIGITHNNNPQEYGPAFGPKYRDSRGQFEGISTKLGPPPPSADPVGRLAFDYYSKGGAGFYGFDAAGKGDGSGDPQVDAQFDKAYAEYDADKRKAIVQDLQKLPGRQGVRRALARRQVGLRARLASRFRTTTSGAAAQPTPTASPTPTGGSTPRRRRTRIGITG